MSAVVPVRIQRKRTKGWKMPPNTVSVTRPGRWSNSWKVGSNMYEPTTNTFRKCETAQDCVDAFRRSVDWDPNVKLMLPTEDGALEISGGYSDEIHVNRSSIRKYLRGKNLACFCALCPVHAEGKPFGLRCDDCSPCHSDPLGEIANARAPDSQVELSKSSPPPPNKGEGE